MAALLETDVIFCVSVDKLTCVQKGAFRFPEDSETRRSDVWASLIAIRPEMFDGNLLRLKEINVDGTAAKLSCEATTFSSYVVSREPSFSTKFPLSERANPLGLTMLVSTTDEHILVTQRSLHAEQNPGGLYFIGGFAEPSAIGGPVDLFAEGARELEEEIGLVEVLRDQSFCIGLGYDPGFCHPELFFVVKTNLEANEVIGNSIDARDRHEAVAIMSVPMSEFFTDNAGLYQNAPLTWSFIKGRELLRRHKADGKL